MSLKELHPMEFDVMAKTIKLKQNQAALILDVSPTGEVTVDAVFPDTTDPAGELAVALCELIGKKLTQDTEFQASLLSELSEGED